jgi:hypothetical protein
MKITVRGWRRDMGKTEIVDHDLLYVEYSDDGTVWRDTPALYHHLGGMKIAWCQPLRLTGNYRMDVHFSGSDIMRLFKCFFGSEIQQELVGR